jgi:hypothetical protein
MQHELKTWPEFFRAVVEGRKTFECRRNDRGFQAGDSLLLREYEPTRSGSAAYTGRACRCDVTYVLCGEQFGVKDGFCVMGIRLDERTSP